MRFGESSLGFGTFVRFGDSSLGFGGWDKGTCGFAVHDHKHCISPIFGETGDPDLELQATQLWRYKRPLAQSAHHATGQAWSMDYQPGGYRQENDLFLNLSLFRYIVSILSGIKCDYDQRVVYEYWRRQTVSWFK